ncbi:hypothetical protein BCR33DRAFT_635755, partial [Rhizoclosmatium globosum]
YPREKFNAALGHAIHMTIVMCHYLGVTLPFQIQFAGGIKSQISTYPRNLRHLLGESAIIPVVTEGDNNAQTPYFLPLFLSDTNRDDFMLGLAVLSYDIAYLCWTQGVTVNTAAGCNLLENLAICCRAVKLG